MEKIKICYEKVSYNEYTEIFNDMHDKINWNYYLLRLYKEDKISNIDGLITTNNLDYQTINSYIENWINNNPVKSYWDCGIFLSLVSSSIDNYTYYLNNPVFEKDTFLDPLLSITNGYLLWKSQFNFLYSLCRNNDDDVDQFRKELNSKKSYAWDKANSIFLPNGRTLANVMTERCIGRIIYNMPEAGDILMVFEVFKNQK